MSLEKYRNSNKEKLRIQSLFGLMSMRGGIALDVGARDGYLSLKLADIFNKVIAVDLELPQVIHGRVECLIGNITCLDFLDNTFDLVLCAEVLEHIAKNELNIACRELARVTKDYLIVGVPCNQDLRLGKTTCYSCGEINPPWGHINKFDLHEIMKLFPNLIVDKVDYVCSSKSRTNFISSFLMDCANNPYGTYSQDELCVFCGNKLVPPKPNVVHKILTKIALTLDVIQSFFVKETPVWIHVSFKKTECLE